MKKEEKTGERWIRELECKSIDELLEKYKVFAHSKDLSKNVLFSEKAINRGKEMVRISWKIDGEVFAFADGYFVNADSENNRHLLFIEDYILPDYNRIFSCKLSNKFAKNIGKPLKFHPEYLIKTLLLEQKLIKDGNVKPAVKYDELFALRRFTGTSLKKINFDDFIEGSWDVFALNALEGENIVFISEDFQMKADKTKKFSIVGDIHLHPVYLLGMPFFTPEEKIDSLSEKDFQKGAELSNKDVKDWVDLLNNIKPFIYLGVYLPNFRFYGNAIDMEIENMFKEIEKNQINSYNYVFNKKIKEKFKEGELNIVYDKNEIRDKIRFLFK